jgi:hypothetical protein
VGDIEPMICLHSGTFIDHTHLETSVSITESAQQQAPRPRDPTLLT